MKGFERKSCFKGELAGELRGNPTDNLSLYLPRASSFLCQTV